MTMHPPGMPPEVASTTPTLIDIVRLSTTYLGDHGSSSARLDSELLCAQALGLRRIDLYLQFDRPLDEQELASIRELVRRRGKGEPVAYITGTREFYGRPFTVTPGRPRPAARHRDTGAARGRLPARRAWCGAACCRPRHRQWLHRDHARRRGSGHARIRDRRQRRRDRRGASQRDGARMSTSSSSKCSWADALDGSLRPHRQQPALRHHRGTRRGGPGRARLRACRGALLGGDDGLDAYRGAADVDPGSRQRGATDARGGPAPRRRRRDPDQRRRFPARSHRPCPT